MEVLQRTANRGSISTASAYEIENSLKLEDDNTENLYRALNGSTSTTKFTVSMWFKRTELGASQLLYHRGVAGNEGVFLRTSTETNDALQVDIGASSTNSRSYTSQLLRDTSAWYHVVLAVDTTQSTDTDRFKLYLNGNLITTFASRANPAEDFAMEVSSAKHRHGAYNDTDGYAGYCGYIAECHYIDGSQVAQTEFGEFDDDSGIWKPKAYAGSYGTGGYYLDFKASGNLGANAEGDDVDFTLNNIAASDQATDTPTNNFCTLALQVRAGTSSEIAPIREGGTYMKQDGVNQSLGFFGTIGVTTGKWYWEVYIPSRSATYGLLDYIGLHSMKTIPVGAAASGGTSQCNYVLHYGDYNATVNGTNSGQNTAAGLPSYGTAGAGKTFGIAFNADDGEITYYANNTRIGNAGIDIFDLHDDMAAGIFVHPFIQVYDNNMYINFGGCSFWASPSDYDKTDANGWGSFAYAPPSGYYALCTKNLAEFG